LLCQLCEQHLKALLEHDSCEVVMAVLRVLSVLATPRSTRQVVCEPPFLAKLSALSTMFSGAANGPLSLAACCQDAPDEVRALPELPLQLLQPHCRLRLVGSLHSFFPVPEI
jgi:hypothetical protein